jgi:hypothetical protein
MRLNAGLLSYTDKREASRLPCTVDTKDERENRRRQKCDADARANDQTASHSSCRIEFTDSTLKVIKPLRSISADSAHAFEPTRELTEKIPNVIKQFEPASTVWPCRTKYRRKVIRVTNPKGSKYLMVAAGAFYTMYLRHVYANN